MNTPYRFDEFFASGLEESISPFLTPGSRPWGRNLSLKSSFCAASLLVLSFGFSFLTPTLSYLFLSFVYFLSGTPAAINAFEDLKNLEINIDVLMTLAAFVAVALGSGLEGALLLVLFELSHGLEDAVSKKTKSALHNLNNLAPKFAHLSAEDGTIFEKAVRDISLGERVLVRQGEIVPLDGIVVEGTSSVNLVHLTGESIPDLKKVGDVVPAGARNLDAALLIEVHRTNTDSTLSRIIQLITAAAEAKPDVQRFLDRFGKTYASLVIFLTLLFAVGLPLLLSTPYFGIEGSIYRALAFMIAASPCALIIATPTAYLSAISACARKGVLLKGGITLDRIAICRIIAFDKTGTLTTGDLECTHIASLTSSNLSLDQALHPIASAICKLATAKNLILPPIQDFKATPGYGLKAVLADGTPIAIGLPEHIFPENWERTTASGLLAALSVGSELFTFYFTDQVRAEIPQLLRKLEIENRLEPIMLTGDHYENAHFVGNLLGIRHIFANLRPEDKLEKVAALSEKKGLAMVGDGINDAPALARATVGISMGRIGSATAVDASDVVLLNDDLHILHWLFLKAKKTQKIVRQNLILALGVILLATTPALLGWVPLWIAVILHEGGTVLVGLNSLRLLKH
jgi:heavy metal translocating P-type ATPase